MEDDFKFQLGELAELQNGVRLFVINQRKIAKSNFYELSFNINARNEHNEIMKQNWENLTPEELVQKNIQLANVVGSMEWSIESHLNKVK